MKERPILFSGPMVRAILDGRKTQTRRLLKFPETNAAPEFPDRFKPEHYTHPCPYGKPGDRLWVRETWACAAEPYTFDFRADMDTPTAESKWRPSIHMPRWASRITLEVVSVRVERLRDISADDALDEGTEGPCSFRNLWERINGPESWDANPWVWVVEFKRIQP